MQGAILGSEACSRHLLDEDLAAQHGRRCVAPGLRAFRRDAPAVANGVVALDLRAGWEGVIMTETQFALWLRSLRIRRFS